MTRLLMHTDPDAAGIAAGELREQFPDREIRCVDTRSASAGFGLLVYMAVETMVIPTPQPLYM